MSAADKTKLDGITGGTVEQARSTSSSWRTLLSHYTATTEGTNPGETTNKVYYNEAVSIQPSTGTLRATAFKGSGASLTSLNASNISSGTIAAARLPAATTSAQGAMTVDMVTKLNGIETGANKYTLPTASSSTLGGVKIGTGIAISSGVISNSGVRSISTGTANGTISVNTNGTSANIAVKGLGSAAYKNASGNWDINVSGYAGSLAASSCSSVDLNTLKGGSVTSKLYYGYTGMTNAPAQAIGILEVIPYSADWVVQRFTKINSLDVGEEYVRHFYNGSTWSDWKTILTTANYKTHVTPANIGAAPSSHTHTVSQISNLKVSATEPTSPTTGMIWIDIS